MPRDLKTVTIADCDEAIDDFLDAFEGDKERLEKASHDGKCSNKIVRCLALFTWYAKQRRDLIRAATVEGDAHV